MAKWPDPATPKRKRYALEILDDATRWQWHILIKKKSDAAIEFERWLAAVERQIGKKVKTI
jgi:hypothetical protein